MNFHGKRMINVITPPDYLYNENPNVLLINPNNECKQNLNDLLLGIDIDLNLYLYDDNEDADWILQTAAASDFVFVDIDNSGIQLRLIIGHLLSMNKTFYLTNDTSLPYNKLNPNKLDSVDIFANKLRGLYGKEQ
jgi:hypothetical protein